MEICREVNLRRKPEAKPTWCLVLLSLALELCWIWATSRGPLVCEPTILGLMWLWSIPQVFSNYLSDFSLIKIVVVPISVFLKGMIRLDQVILFLIPVPKSGVAFQPVVVFLLSILGLIIYGQTKRAREEKDHETQNVAV